MLRIFCQAYIGINNDNDHWRISKTAKTVDDSTINDSTHLIFLYVESQVSNLDIFRSLLSLAKSPVENTYTRFLSSSFFFFFLFSCKHILTTIYLFAIIVDESCQMRWLSTKATTTTIRMPIACVWLHRTS